MSSTFKYLSSGGLGDAWICFLKIWDDVYDGFENVHWEHMTSHQVHVDPVTELMTLMPRIVYGKCHKIDKQSYQATERTLTAANEGIKRLNTVAGLIGDATPQLLWFEPRFKEQFGDYVVIQPAAGRPDNSYRCFMPYAIMELVEHFGGKKIVLLGAEFKGAVPDNVVNLTNRTPIKTAIEIVKGADHFVGFDGFLAYVAMSMRVPTTLIFHDPRLPEHYMNPQWEEHTKWLIGPQRISDQVDLVIERC